jgi:PKHD-type hydroxylase
MMLQIENFLQAEAVAMLLDLVEQGRFEDGRATAGAELQSVKANEQLRITEREGRVIQKVLLPAMERNQAFQSFAWPRRLHVPRLSRYRVGMEYGAHIDNPIMGGADPIRTDLSMTLFLSDPTTYEGGELILETAFGEQSVKMPAGGAVVYSTAFLHRVAPVSRGERIALVTWIQSLVKSPDQRQILSDIAIARENLKRTGGDPAALTQLLKIQTNLLKMWSEV